MINLAFIPMCIHIPTRKWEQEPHQLCEVKIYISGLTAIYIGHLHLLQKKLRKKFSIH